MGAALLIGLLAALAARHFLSAQIEAIQKRDKGRQVEQVVAKVALSKGSVISSDTVAVRLSSRFARCHPMTQATSAGDPFKKRAAG